MQRERNFSTMNFLWLVSGKYPKNFEELGRDEAYDLFALKYHSLPRIIRRHRKYFVGDQRGFGENAFHAAWFYIFGKYRPLKCLEIGVYRGQTLSLWALISKKMGQKIEIVGITPLSSIGDSVSTYPDLDYRADITENFDKFNLAQPILIQQLSQSSIAKEKIEKGDWDLIYIDGSHEFDVCLSDVLSAEQGLKSGGLLVVDDSSLYTNFSRSFKGHPGPSKVVSEHLSDSFKKILSVGHNNFFIKL